MKTYDFMYDKHTLSEFGLIVCSFDDKGVDIVSNGAVVSFNTVSVSNGQKHDLTSVQYEECLETKIQVCKNPCSGDTTDIPSAVFRQLTKWLSRKKFLKFKPLSDDYIDIFYEAKIDVSRIELNGRLIGLELQITTNRPFALKEPRTITIKNISNNGKYSLNDISHEEGYIYPFTEITIQKDGDLNIYNAIENRDTHIANCIAGEVITMDYPVIKSSVSSHNIQNDFNWNFFRVANTYDNSRNDLTISIPCTIKVKYSPIVKVGL